MRGGESRSGLAGDAGHQSPGISHMPVGIDLKKASGGVVGVEVVGGGPGGVPGPNASGGVGGGGPGGVPGPKSSGGVVGVGNTSTEPCQMPHSSGGVIGAMSPWVTMEKSDLMRGKLSGLVMKVSKTQ